MATKTQVVTDARVSGGKLLVYLPGKAVIEFENAAAVDAVLDDLRRNFSPEAMVAMALKKLGQGNHNLLDGRTITVDLDVTISLI